MRAFELFEKRRNPDLNPKVSAIDALRKYEGHPDVYVSFTHDVGAHSLRSIGDETFGGIRSKGTLANQRGSKIGINPKTNYNTPVGIYCYPVDYVLKKFVNDVPFAAKRPYLYVVKARGNVLDLHTYSQEDYDKDAAKLRAMNLMSDTQFQEMQLLADSTSTSRTPGGKIWNLTRLLSGRRHGMYNQRSPMNMLISATWKSADFETGIPPNDRKLIPHSSTLKTAEDVEKYKAAFNRQSSVATEKTPMTIRELLEVNFKGAVDALNKATPEQVLAAVEEFRRIQSTKGIANWSKLFRDLGYSGASDLQGKGIIHENEPTQAVFFSKAGIQELEVLNNVQHEKPKGQTTIFIEKPKLFKAWIHKHKGEYTPDEIKMMTEVIGYNHDNEVFADIYPMFPAEVKSYVREHWERIGFPLDAIDFTDKQMVNQVLNYQQNFDPHYFSGHAKGFYRAILRRPHVFEAVVNDARASADLIAGIVNQGIVNHQKMIFDFIGSKPGLFNGNIYKISQPILMAFLRQRRTPQDFMKYYQFVKRNVYDIVSLADRTPAWMGSLLLYANDCQQGQISNLIHLINEEMARTHPEIRQSDRMEGLNKYWATVYDRAEKLGLNNVMEMLKFETDRAEADDDEGVF
jgi:hypothetical protein